MAKTAKFPMPTNSQEANELFRRMRELQRTIAASDADCEAQIQELEAAFAEIKLAHDEQVTTLRRVAEERTASTRDELAGLAGSMRRFATKSRSTLLAGDEKTAKLLDGYISWERDSFWRVVTGKVRHETIIADLESRGGNWAELYVRIKKTLNKRALGERRPVIPGIKYTQRETLILQTISPHPESTEIFPAIKFRL